MSTCRMSWAGLPSEGGRATPDGSSPSPGRIVNLRRPLVNSGIHFCRPTEAHDWTDAGCHCLGMTTIDAISYHCRTDAITGVVIMEAEG